MHERQADLPTTVGLHALWSSLTRLSVALSHIENDLQDLPGPEGMAAGAMAANDSTEWLRAYA